MSLTLTQIRNMTDPELWHALNEAKEEHQHMNSRIKALESETETRRLVATAERKELRV